MSAMHWEARRRQKVVDRRMVTKTKQCDTEEEQNPDTAEKHRKEIDMPPTMSAVNTVIDKRILSQYLRVTHARMENRYTSTQYSQQW